MSNLSGVKNGGRSPSTATGVYADMALSMPSFPSKIPNQIPIAIIVQINADQKKSLGSGKNDLNNVQAFLLTGVLELAPQRDSFCFNVDL